MNISAGVLALIGWAVFVLLGCLFLLIIRSHERKIQEIPKKYSGPTTDEKKQVVMTKYMEIIDEDYKKRDEVIDELAETLNRSRRSIVAMLHREGLYKAPTNKERRQLSRSYKPE